MIYSNLGIVQFQIEIFNFLVEALGHGTQFANLGLHIIESLIKLTLGLQIALKSLKLFILGGQFSAQRLNSFLVAAGALGYLTAGLFKLLIQGLICRGEPIHFLLESIVFGQFSLEAVNATLEVIDLDRSLAGDRGTREWCRRHNRRSRRWPGRGAGFKWWQGSANRLGQLTVDVRDLVVAIGLAVLNDARLESGKVARKALIIFLSLNIERERLIEASGIEALVALDQADIGLIHDLAGIRQRSLGNGRKKSDTDHGQQGQGHSGYPAG